MNKHILVGLNTGHDGGVAIAVNDKVACAIGEERLSREKYSRKYLNALQYCLEKAGVSIDEVTQFFFSSYGPSLPKGYLGDLKEFGVTADKSIIVDHHLSHAYGAFCSSPFDKAIILVMDGQGNDNSTESYYIATQKKIEKFGGNSKERPMCKGIGRTYEAFTNYLGWVDQHAGKTMGLAAYGDPERYTQPLFTLRDLEVVGELDYLYEQGVIGFAKKHKLDFGDLYGKGKTQASMDVAAYVQRQTELIITQLVKRLVAKTGIRNICLSGGVALNCNTNGVILNLDCVDNLFIIPASSDRGQCLGNVLFGMSQLSGKIVKAPMLNDYFGKEYTEKEILEALGKAPIAHIKKSIPTKIVKYKKQPNIAKSTAKLLYHNKIVAWFQGGSELGPRALGHRSIVCNPIDANMKDILNKRIKHREEFRPFAPSCLFEHAQEYFEISTESPFMLHTVPVIKGERIGAVVHKDGTARIQTVTKKANGVYYDLIKEFYKLSGVPVILNTSFNDQEPIVESPTDAVSTFMSTDIDFLAIGDYLAWKEDVKE